MLIKENWLSFLNEKRITDPQYSYEYASLTSKSEMFAVEENGMSALLIFQYDGKSRSFETPYGYGSFWTNTSDEVFINEFFASFYAEMSKRGCVAGLIRYNPFVILPKTELVKNEYVREVVCVDLTQNYLKNVKRRTLGDINRAKKHEINLKISTEEEDFIEFENIYKELMTEKNAEKELLFGVDYFRKLSKLKNSMLVCARRENELIGGASFLFGAEMSYYHLSAVREKKRYPGLSSLILSIGIEKVQEMKGKKILLGGGTTSAKDDPLLFFKEGFSPIKFPFCIGKMTIDEKEYRELTSKHDVQYPHSKRLFLRYKYEVAL
ncbi:MAG: hypothetical protein AB7T10_02755 [bacterium]